MTDIDENEIALEAHRLWIADGSPLWGHPQDHWYRAIANLRVLRQQAEGEAVADPEAHRGPER